MDAARAQVIRRWLLGALACIPVLYLCLFLLYPLGRIFVMGLTPLVASGGQGFGRVAEETGVAGLLLASAWQAFLSTILTLALGLPAAHIFARFDFPGKAVLRTLLSIPFVLPTVVVGSAFIVLIGPGGALERLVVFLTGDSGVEVNLMRTLTAVLLAHVFYNVSIVVRIVGGSWASLDPRLREAARVLGAGRIASSVRVTLRLLLPAIAASSILVFAFCFTSFGVILILGGPRIGTIETEIYRQAVHLFNLPGAAFLSALQLAITGAVMFAYSRIQARMSVIQNLSPGSVTQKHPRSVGQWALVLVCGIGLTAGLLLPLWALAASSFMTRSGFGFQYWISLFRDVRHSIFYTSPLQAAAHSLMFSAATVVISLSLGVPAAYVISRTRGTSGRIRAVGSGIVDLLFLLPLGTSAVTLGFGFIISLNSPPLELRSSILLIPIAHSLVALPLVVRSLLAPLSSINPRLRETAALLGSGPLRVRLEVDLPILRRAFIAAAAFAFTVSMGEFAATALLTRPDLATIPVVIYGFLTQPGELNQGQALAMSTILMAVCGLGLAAIERFRAGGTEVF